MRYPSPVEVSAVCPLLWLVTALLLPAGEVLGAPTQVSYAGRPSRGDRTAPPLQDIDGDTTETLPRAGDSVVGERVRREAKEATAVGSTAREEREPPAANRQPSGSSRQSGLGAQEPGNSPPKASEPRMDSRKVHRPDSDEDYYYYYYYDSFVEGVTTREDLGDYSESGAPVDLEDGEDDSDDGEIMELLNLMPRQKKMP